MAANSFRPRFSLRTLLVLVTVFGCWLGYQLNWIRQRHEFFEQHSYKGLEQLAVELTPRAPGMLWLFGEKGKKVIMVSRLHWDDAVRAKKLFPESDVCTD
jgi:hypothetical protein